MDYLESLPEITPKLLEFIRNVYFYVAPSEMPRRMLKRIEAAIAEHLRGQGGKVGSFFDRTTNTDRRRPEEEPVDLIIQRPSELVGLPDLLKV